MLDAQSLKIGDLAERLNATLEQWESSQLVRRMWDHDHTVWSREPQPELSDRLGWLDLPAKMAPEVARLSEFTESVIADGLKSVVLCGMGGSSLAPDVFARTFGSADGFLELMLVDSTHPDEVARVVEMVDPATSLFLIASKSGGTLETMSLFRTFWAATQSVIADPGRHFVAITDPGSALEKLAAERGFRDTFATPPDVGGRYSALTFFGLVPAALIGVDVGRLLDRASLMANACGPDAPTEANPGAVLGATMGLAAKQGQDKVTYLVPPRLAAFPVWVEQLVAESTGKDDVGVIPVADEPVGDASEYSDDRLVIHLDFEGEEDPHAGLVSDLRAGGTPVVSITVNSIYDIAQEMYRAEFATALAGAVLEINPFNQPNVQQAKELAKEAMERKGSGADIEEIGPDDEAALDQWLAGFSSGDYVGIQAYLPYGIDAELASIRTAVRSSTHGATTLGYGPRFLHSTGQLHKGGANNGMFIQIIDEPENETPVPETDFSFRKLVRAQADGDFQALIDRERRVLRINLGSDRVAGLRTLVASFESL